MNVTSTAGVTAAPCASNKISLPDVNVLSASVTVNATSISLEPLVSVTTGVLILGLAFAATENAGVVNVTGVLSTDWSISNLSL